MPHPLQLHLKNLLIRNAGEVLQQLQKVFINNPDTYNMVINLTTRLEKIRKDKIGGTLLQDAENHQLNEINQGILALIDSISPEEAAAYELENAIFKRILVVCKSADRERYMRRLFPSQYYKGVEFDVSEKPRPAASVNQFDLVIFDNFPPGAPADSHELLTYYLTQTEPCILYFGQTLPLLWQYPEKAYFANAVFSIHARIEEMITYLKYYKG